MTDHPVNQVMNAALASKQREILKLVDHLVAWSRSGCSDGCALGMTVTGFGSGDTTALDLARDIKEAVHAVVVMPDSHLQWLIDNQQHAAETATGLDLELIAARRAGLTRRIAEPDAELRRRLLAEIAP